MKERNPAIDLLRCVLMLGICMRHAVGYSGYASGCETRLWSWCVPGFAFISGYYGVRFSWRKLGRLWGVAATVIVIPALIQHFVGGGLILNTYVNYLTSNWYLNAYVVLMLMSPMLNAGLEKVKSQPMMLIPLVALMIWSWLSEQWGTRNYVPHLNGIGQQSFFALLYPYILAWGYRTFDWRQYLTRGRVIALGCLAIALMPFLGMNTSPITLAFVMVVFAFFERCRLPHWASAGVAFLSPSMFSVYLIHTNELGFSMINKACHYLTETWHLLPYASIISCALAIFVLCTAIDLIRRGLVVKTGQTENVTAKGWKQCGGVRRISCHEWNIEQGLSRHG